MGRVKIIALGVVYSVVATVGFGSFSGCDGGGSNETISTPPEVKKADENLQGGMKEFMQSKGQSKTKSGR